MTANKPYQQFPRFLTRTEPADIKKKHGIDTVYRMSANETPLGPSPRAVAAMQAAAANVGMYPPIGTEPLREALADIWGQDLTRDNFYFGCSGYETIELAARAYLRPGDEMIVCPPTFNIYYKVAALEGAVAVDAPLKTDFTIDVEAVLSAVNDKTRMVILCNPNNPTGNMAVTRTQMDRLMNALPEDVVLVADEVYYQFVENDQFPNSVDYVQQGKSIILIHSFSKVYGLPGLRLGYGIAPVEIADYVAGFHRGFHINGIAQAGALAAMQDPAHMQRNIDVARGGRKWICKQLDELGLEYVPSETNFVLIKLPVDSGMVAAELEKEGVMVRPLSGGSLHNCLRVSSTHEAGNERFIAGLARILEQAA